MKRQFPLLCLLLLAAQFPAARDVRACACCTNPGDRLVTSKAIDANEQQIIGSLRFAETAQLSIGEADPESIKGVRVKSDRLSLRVRRTPNTWTFSFDDGAGNKGDLFFAVPKRIRLFQVDPHGLVARQSNGGGPVLYKEWKLTSPAKGNGLLQGSVGGRQGAALIFHGHGNHCPNPSDFVAWTLVLYGPKAQVTFFGMLRN